MDIKFSTVWRHCPWTGLIPYGLIAKCKWKHELSGFLGFYAVNDWQTYRRLEWSSASTLCQIVHISHQTQTCQFMKTTTDNTRMKCCKIKEKTVFLPQSVHAGNGAHPASYLMSRGGSSTGVDRAGRDANHLHPSRVEFRNDWSYTSTIPCDFMECTGRTNSPLIPVLQFHSITLRPKASDAQHVSKCNLKHVRKITREWSVKNLHAQGCGCFRKILKPLNVPSNFLFTAVRTWYCSVQKIFTRPDDCAVEVIFVIWIIIKIIFTMEIEKFQLRGHNSVCAGAFQSLRGRAPAHLRGNIEPLHDSRRKKPQHKSRCILRAHK
jgi:hypothetical protein